MTPPVSTTHPAKIYNSNQDETFDKKTLQGTVLQSNLESETLVESFSLLNTR